MGLSSGFKREILDRIKEIPIVDTLQIKVISLSDGYCETKVPRKLEYDGVFESFHGGLLMTVADSRHALRSSRKQGHRSN